MMSVDLNNESKNWEVEIRSSLNRNSVKEISAKFTGSSKIETKEAYEQRMRKARIPTLSRYGSNKEELKKVASPIKIKMMKEWRQTESSNVISVEAAKTFLADCGVTVDNVDQSNWTEWMEAVDIATSNFTGHTLGDSTENLSLTTTANKQINYEQAASSNNNENSTNPTIDLTKLAPLNQQELSNECVSPIVSQTKDSCAQTSPMKSPIADNDLSKTKINYTLDVESPSKNESPKSPVNIFCCCFKIK